MTKRARFTSGLSKGGDITKKPKRRKPSRYERLCGPVRIRRIGDPKPNYQENKEMP